ncbi:hypothetical protein Acid345_3170 [Candidatus Koribacter versatilis Ellin345]|uniref:Phage head-tail adaptor n=1 Tax=Koribacter versatilis (strain Ellin345) TaxID=204669 RepID=Q1ILS9_KORVE|nr:hypothetical protein [Candidatus Koribacter versatilis]ABF42171.1 hypothetical protein Acid345_3170 [Candidatus Koribacter versatilis Ellin345]
MPTLPGGSATDSGPFGSQDLDVFFQDGSTVQRANLTKFKAHFDMPEVIEPFSVGGEVQQVMGKPQIRFASNAVPDLAPNEVLKIAGGTYRVRSVDKESDGLVSVARLAKVT